MPPLAKTRRTPTRTTAKRSRSTAISNPRSRPATMKLVRPVYLGRQTMPDRLVNKLRYSDQFGISISSGVGFHVFSANGLFDVDITGVGHQPLVFDQMMGLYDHYTVINSKLKLSLMNGTSSVGLATVALNDDSSTPTLISMREGPKSQTKPWTSNLSPVIVSYFNAKSFFGDNVENNSLYRGSAASNPTEQAYYAIRLDEPSLLTFTFEIFVEIEYTVLWSELKLQNPS